MHCTVHILKYIIDITICILIEVIVKSIYMVHVPTDSKKFSEL